ncbi:MAG: FAD-binding oxidoreductase, partial [Actinomycetes bacterium]
MSAPSSSPGRDHGPAYAAWGPPGSAPALSRRARAFLADRLGPPVAPPPPVPLDAAAARVGPTALDAVGRAALEGAVGAEHLHLDGHARARRAAGLSYLDLLRLRAGDVAGAPDAVACPATHEEVRAVLDACAVHDLAVLPVGGGTSVVGGVEPDRGGHAALVVLDLTRMDRVLDLDPVSRTVTVQPGLRGPDLESALAPHRLTLGHLPQSFARATVGGWVATRSAGQASGGYGRLADMVTTLRLAAPAGDLRLGRGPASAAGPDLRHLVLGSEGALGVVTEVGLRVRRLPAVRRYEAWAVPGLGLGMTLLRTLVQDGAAPDVARLSDPDETRATLALSGPSGAAGALARAYLATRIGPRVCLLVLGWEGSAPG